MWAMSPCLRVRQSREAKEQLQTINECWQLLTTDGDLSAAIYKSKLEARTALYSVLIALNVEPHVWAQYRAEQGFAGKHTHSQTKVDV